MSSKFFTVKTHILPGQYIREYSGATLKNQEDVLHIHIKQYTPCEPRRSGGTGFTIIGTHANGFPKELYEPLWDELYIQATEKGMAIASIWIADVAHQGQSFVLNEDKIGSDPSWNDHPRDLLHMINHFRDQMPRPIVGIGHSMGGSALVNLSIMHPRLLTSVVLIDPVIQNTPFAPGARPETKGTTDYTRLSTFRRDLWPSRSAAATSFNNNPFYKSWDPRVLTLWNKFALRELPTAIYSDPSISGSQRNTPQSQKMTPTEKPVTLTTTKHQEVFTFLRPNFPTPGQPILNRNTHPDIDPLLPDEWVYPFYRPESAAAFRLLPNLRPSAFYIFGGSSEVSPPNTCKEKLETTGTGAGGNGGAKEGRVKSVTLEGIGHLIPMVAPTLCAEKAMEWLAPELQRWQAEEERWTREWQAAGRRERQVISEAYRTMIGGDPRVKTTSEKL